MCLETLWQRILGPGKGLGVAELARRLGVSETALRNITPAYREFTVPKRAGGARRICAPEDDLKKLQRRIARRLLARLRSHPLATGFEKGVSVVMNAAAHAGKAVVVRMDLRTFFESTSARRVTAYFRRVGWNRHAARLLAELCTHRGGLPQGAPTSPRLSNLLNYRLDCRLEGLARRFAAVYTRYADDIVFSFDKDDPKSIHAVIWCTKDIVRQHGYALHQHRKLRIRRRHQQQTVTGLVVNDRPRLSRSRRRWLRAVEHHLAAGRPATLTEKQLAGWRSYQSMIEKQSSPPETQAPS